MARPPLLVSACLAGVPCRYDGAALPDDELVALVAAGAAVAVCPEVAAGLPTPRDAVEIVGGDGHDVLDGRARVVAASGADCTEAFRVGAEHVVARAAELGATDAFLQARSPSCGAGLIHDGAFAGRLVTGDGVLAAALQRAGVRVESRRGARRPE